MKGTLNLGNFKLTIGNSLYLGYGSGGTGTVLRGNGYFSVPNLYVDNGNAFTFGALDVVTSNLDVSGSASATTTAAGNVTGDANVSPGATLTLGANMTLSGNLDLRDTGSVLDMAGRSLTANQIFLGWDGGSPTLRNRGPLTADYLAVSNIDFNLNAGDTVLNFSLSNGTSTINAAVSGLTLNNATATWHNSIAVLELDNNATATTTAADNVAGIVEI